MPVFNMGPNFPNILNIPKHTPQFPEMGPQYKLKQSYCLLLPNTKYQ
jgi:hypothetical protein